jgi:hypothetical protein
MTTLIGIACSSPLWPLLRDLLRGMMGRDLAQDRRPTAIHTLTRDECAAWGQLAARAAGPN